MKSVTATSALELLPSISVSSEMDGRTLLLQQIETLSEAELGEVLNFIALLKEQGSQQALECEISCQREVLETLWEEDEEVGWIDL